LLEKNLAIASYTKALFVQKWQMFSESDRRGVNKISHWWFVLKNWMRQRWDKFVNFRDCVDAAFKQCPNVLA